MTQLDQMFEDAAPAPDDWMDPGIKATDHCPATFRQLMRRFGRRIGQWIIRRIAGETTQEAYSRGRSDVWDLAQRAFRK